jgi:tetratricopeptide (TPR) repeat protein
VRDARTWLLALLLGVVTTLVFSPTLGNDFNYDDVVNIEANLNYRGLGVVNLKWMFTTFEAGHYQPLAWVTLGLDYVLWGMRPFGYHLTNLLLHIANVLLVYLIALRIIDLSAHDAGMDSRETGCEKGFSHQREKGFSHQRGFAHPRVFSHQRLDGGMQVGAALAALLFGLHPLRVESVAWVTERRDVLSSSFLLASVFAYLTAHRPGAQPHRLRWISIAFVSFVLSLFSRAMGVTLPLILLLLDRYPLRRWGVAARESRLGGFRAALVEKVPFVIVALAAAFVAPLAQRFVGAAIPVAQHSIVARIAQACYGLAFYMWKTVAPVGLIPIYELHLPLNPLALRFILSGVLVVAAAVALLLLRRRYPAVSLAAACYAILLLPVLGFVQSGQQEVADRYSYLPSIGWTILAGGALAWLWRSRPGALRAAALLAPALVIGGLSVLSWRQCLVWRTPESLWTHTVRWDANCATGQYNLGTVLARRGDAGGALPYLRRAVSINAGYVDAFYNLGNALTELKRPAEAVEAYRATIRLKPSYPQAHFHLANALAAIGESDAAVQHYRLAVQHRPDYFEARYSLALQLGDHGRPAEALPEYREALRLKPDDPDLHYDFGRALALSGDAEAAMAEYREALRLRPNFPAAHINLGVALMALGRRDEAVQEYQKALELKPDFAEAHYNLANMWNAQGKSEDAMRAYREALRINPAYVEAHINLGNALGRSGRTSEAIQEYEEALRLNPGHPDAHYNLGAALGLQGKLDEAVAHFREVLRVRPNDTAARLNLGAGLAALGRVDEAAAEYREILRIDPDHADARNRLNALPHP